MIAVPVDRGGSRRSIRLLALTQALGYATLALTALAVLAGGDRAWLGAAAVLLATIAALALTLTARRRPEVLPPLRTRDENDWRPPWADLYERPTNVVARCAAFLFSVFTLTSTAAAMWVDPRIWAVPTAYAVTAAVALAVWGATSRGGRRRDARRAPIRRSSMRG